MFYHKIKIGNVELNNNIFLAPLAGITDMPYRQICKEHGAGLTCTEMISAKGLYYKDEKTKKLMELSEAERPACVQLFGNDPLIMGEAAKIASEYADIIDINMGCPAPKVVRNNDGSKILLDLELAEKIIISVVNNSKVPVTLKIRKGWDDEHIVAVELAQIAEKNGISAITIHGRTRQEFFAGDVDYDIIRKVKETVNIPVIANGNINSGEMAKKVFEITNCDGIMIGRGALGNPWIFDEIREYLCNDVIIAPPQKDEIKGTILKHLYTLKDYKNERVAVLEMRKFIAWYTKGMPNSSYIRSQINSIEDFQDLVNKIKEL